MFTGIVREVGRVRAASGSRLEIVSGLKPGLGDSVAVSGVCLTVAKRAQGALRFDVSTETLKRTTLGALRPGNGVNLEPALRLGEELGGHLVSGHVDATAGVLALEGERGGFATLRVALPAALKGLVALKGSVCVDGVSLTVSRLARGFFEAALVPHTLERTTLSGLAKGASVNLEADMLARYVRAALGKA